MQNKLKKELDGLVAIIKASPSGISIEEIQAKTDSILPRRTLQYRLAILVDSGIIKLDHAGRNSKYSIVQFQEQTLKEESSGTPFKISLSLEAKEVQKQISLPLQQRRHVSYQRDFLDSYEPNKTFYLSDAMIKKLTSLGSSLEKERPAGTLARKIYKRLLVDLAWNSSRLEGNTYSLLETERLLANGEEAPGKNRIDTQMILNHKAAIEFIVDEAEEIEIKNYIILNIHALLSNELLIDPGACGRLRTIPVKISQSVYHPIEIPQVIEELFQIIVKKASKIINPFEQSFFLMVHLPYLQPFVDVNKRVARLVGNIPFIRHNISPLSFVDVSESDYIQGLLAIYELNRIELFRDVFIWAYERSASLYSATLGSLSEPDPFRVRYSKLINEAVRFVVLNKMDKIKGAHFISSFATKNLNGPEKNRFVQIVEIELSSIHEGNFARFKLRPQEFFNWRIFWK